MAATATAQTFNPQNAAANLRQDKNAAKRAEPSILSKMSGAATKNVRAAMLGASLMADSTFSRGAELEDIEGDQIEEAGGGGGGSHMAGLSDQAGWAAAERQRMIQSATSRDTFREYGSSEEAREQDMTYRLAEDQLRQQSLDTDVSQLGPIRGAKQKMADKAANALAEKAKTEAMQFAVRWGADGAGALADVTEGAALETDLGIGTATDIAYKYARFGRTILIPPATNVGTSAGDAASYTANKAIDIALPPYVLFGTISQIVDTADLAFTLLVTVPVFITIGALGFILLTALAYGIYYSGSIFALFG